MHIASQQRVHLYSDLAHCIFRSYRRYCKCKTNFCFINCQLFHRGSHNMCIYWKNLSVLLAAVIWQIVCKSEYLVTKKSISSIRVLFNICIKSHCFRQLGNNHAFIMAVLTNYTWLQLPLVTNGKKGHNYNIFLRKPLLHKY